MESDRTATRLVGSFPRGHEPPPTVIVFSGGGHQGFWKLDEPVPIDDPERIPDLEAYSRQLEVELEADHCHNVDRIMRLVGTVNVPGRIKRKRGRVPVLATLVEWHDDRSYPLDRFPRGASPSAERTAGVGEVDVPDRLPPVDIEKLPVSDRCKTVILNGQDHDDPFKSRSHAVWFVACQMVAAGRDDPTIASVLLDTTLGISAHVRGQGLGANSPPIRLLRQPRASGPCWWRRNIPAASRRGAGGPTPPGARA